MQSHSRQSISHRPRVLLLIDSWVRTIKFADATPIDQQRRRALGESANRKVIDPFRESDSAYATSNSRQHISGQYKRSDQSCSLGLGRAVRWLEIPQIDLWIGVNNLVRVLNAFFLFPMWSRPCNVASYPNSRLLGQSACGAEHAGTSSLAPRRKKGLFRLALLRQSSTWMEYIDRVLATGVKSGKVAWSVVEIDNFT